MTKPVSFSLWLAPVVLAAATACSSQSVSTNAQASAPASERPQGMPMAAPAHDAAPAAAAAGQVATGTVVETMNAATYTYVKVKSDKGEIWAASSQFEVKVGDQVQVPLEQPMENFHSQSLNRDFPLIYFASSIARGGAGAPAMGASGQPQMPPGHPPAAAPATTVTEKIAPPAGGKSVADVWADRKALSGKTVTVRGKVVKFNGGILDRNWVHLQDGSGKADDKTNDITITTDAVVKVGDVVTVTGTVLVDKDFGAGYAYPVLIENGKVQ